MSYLIEEKPAKAKLFNDSLADVYRYILHNKGSDLVLLRDEMDFLKKYFALLKIRFEGAVQLNIYIEELLYEQFVIPPTSLQVLAENAIKHNEFSDDTPLIIDIELKNDEVIVRNQVHKKTLRKPSSHIGLDNLNKRYQLTTNKKISVNKTEKEFAVCLPVLKIT